MRNVLPISALLVAVVVTPSLSYGFDLCRLLGLGCGDAYGCGCGCEPTCGCGGYGYEAGCGCEPSCGCGESCGCDGRQYGGQAWNCCDECGPPICPCTGPVCCGCEPSCGCDDAYGCGCEASCGCEPACGCGSSCGGTCGHVDCGFGSCCGRVVGLIDRLCGCTGCNGELYWSEWHNDPPRCCDPCDRCGNWVGPGYGYRAPYEHAYPAGGYVDGAYYTKGKAAKSPAAVARSSRPAGPPNAARSTYVGQAPRQVPPATKAVRPSRRAQAPARGQVTRRPNVGPSSTYQR